MTECPAIDISPTDWEIVREILGRLIPGREVRAFGSRVTGAARRYSDLDLAVICERPLDLATSAALSDAFAESDLPFKVDVVDWATASESFRTMIKRDGVLVRHGRCDPSTTSGKRN